MLPLVWTNQRLELDGDCPIESKQILVVGFCLLGFQVDNIDTQVTGSEAFMVLAGVLFKRILKERILIKKCCLVVSMKQKVSFTFLKVEDMKHYDKDMYLKKERNN